MAIQRRFCSNHPDRPALGVCVITLKPICGECSTRYEGVNYSREGLRILQERRAKAAASTGRRGRSVFAIVGWCVSPILLYLVYLGYVLTADALMSLLRHEL